jgi:SAM-dependent methyltransferase
MTTSGGNLIEIISPLQQHTFLESWYELSDESHFWFQWRLAALMRQLCDLDFPVHEKLKALDVGCGTGVLRSQIEAVTAWEIDVTDLDYAALRQAKPGRGRILYYDILEERAEMREQYDIVILFDVLEHIEHTQPFIRALLSHLKPGGFLLVNVPALQSLYSRYDQVVGHVRRYSEKTLLDEFRDFTLSVRDIRYWGLANVPIILARKLWLAMKPRGETDVIIQNGFKPPNQLVNEAFLRLMRLEMNVIGRLWLGSSVLMVGEKSK